MGWAPVRRPKRHPNDRPSNQKTQRDTPFSRQKDSLTFRWISPPPHLQVSPSPPQAFHSGLPLSLWNWGMEQGSVCLCMCVAASLFWSFEDIFEESVREEHRTARGSGSGERMWAGLGGGCGHTSVCRSMISWPTRGMVALVFSHSTACNSKGDDATVSRSFLTQDGGEWVFRMPSHALLLGVCGLSYRQRGQKGREKNTRCWKWPQTQSSEMFWCPFVVWLIGITSASTADRPLSAHTLFIQSHSYDILWAMLSMQRVKRLYQNDGKLKERTKKGNHVWLQWPIFYFFVFLPCYVKQTSLELGQKKIKK